MLSYEFALVTAQQQNPEMAQGGGWLVVFAMLITLGFWLLARK